MSPRRVLDPILELDQWRTGSHYLLVAFGVLSPEAIVCSSRNHATESTRPFLSVASSEQTVGERRPAQPAASAVSAHTRTRSTVGAVDSGIELPGGHPILYIDMRCSI